MKIIVINNYKEPEKARQALENLTRCTGQHMEMLDYKVHNLFRQFQEHDPDLAILTGSNFMLSKHDTRLVFQQEIDLVREIETPFLGICFGHQLIGSAFGSEVVDLGQTVREFKEVRLLDRDPIFDGLPDKIRVSESHRQVLKQVPDDFRHLAESSSSTVEAIVHRARPVYGFQFHPERSDERHPAGEEIMRNFLKIAARA